jgi:hypothetical protein
MQGPERIRRIRLEPCSGRQKYGEGPQDRRAVGWPIYNRDLAGTRYGLAGQAK